MQFNKENLVLAHQILDGIPESVIRLDAWCTRRGESKACGTIACGGGWLALHPKFNRKGLVMDNRYNEPTLRGGCTPAYVALNTIFGAEAANHLFAHRGGSPWDEELLERAKPRKLSDKALLLARLKKAYYTQVLV